MATLAAGLTVSPLLLALGYSAEAAAAAAITFTSARLVAPLAITFIGLVGGTGSFIAGAFKRQPRDALASPNYVHLGEALQSPADDLTASPVAPPNDLSAAATDTQTEYDVIHAAEVSSPVSPQSALGDPFTSLSPFDSDDLQSPPTSPASLSDCDSTDSENDELVEADTGARSSTSRLSLLGCNGLRTGRRTHRVSHDARLELLASGTTN